MEKFKSKRFIIATLSMSLLFSNFTYAVEGLQTEENHVESTYEESSQSFKDFAKRNAQKTLDDNYLESIQYAIVDNGEVTLSDNINSPSGQESIYGTGSISKVYTTAIAMKLVEEGKLDLDKPVVEYVKDFKMKDERYKKITFRMLINHSSGITEGSLLNAFQVEYDSYYHDSFLENISNKKLYAEPGEIAAYNNDGYTLAEIVIERITGKSFEENLKKHVSEPLGTSNTIGGSELAKKENFVNTGSEVSNVIAAGGVYSTAEEIGKMGAMFTNGNTLLTQKSKDRTFEKEYEKGVWGDIDVDNSFVGYGLGWDAVDVYPFTEYDIKAVSKGGDTMVYHSSLIVLPEKNMSVAVVSSGGNSMMNQALASEIIIEYLIQKGDIVERAELKRYPVVEESLPLPEEIKNYKGLYGAVTSAVKMEIEFENDDLIIKTEPEQRLKHIGDGYFTDPTGAVRVSFKKAKNNEIYLQQDNYFDIPLSDNVSQIAMSMMGLQKMERKTVGKESLEYWQKKLKGITYFPLDVKHNSIYYTLMNIYGMDMGQMLSDEYPEFIGVNVIESESLAKATLEIPGNMGRTSHDIRLEKEDGKTFLKTSITLLSGEDVESISAYENSYATILDNGYARWYKIGEDVKGMGMKYEKTIKNAMVAAYKADGSLKSINYNDSGETIDLSDVEYVVFAGLKGAKINIRMTN